jgi:hypothetical protein
MLKRTHGWLLAMVTLLVAGSLAGPALAQDATPVASPVAGAPLDLAAMTLTVDDLAEVGLTDYVIADGRSQSLMDRAIEQSSSADEAQSTLSGLQSIGWDRGYRSRLARQTDASTESFDALVSSGVTVFTDDADMELAWSLLSQVDAGSGAETVDDTEIVGDNAVFTKLGQSQFDDGTLHEASRYMFLTGNIVGDIIVFAPENEVIAAAQIVELAKTQLARIDSARSGDAPGLSNKVLRWRGLGLTDPDLANYLKLDGVAWNSLGDEEVDIARSIESYQDATTHFRYEAALSETIFQQSSIALFPTETLAEAWVAGAYDRTVANTPEDGSVEILADAPSFSDDSVTMKALIPNGQGGTATGYAIAVSYGQEGVLFSVISVGDLSESVALELLSAEIACYESGDCTESVELPADFPI